MEIGIKKIKGKVLGLMDKADIVRRPINRNDRIGMFHKSWGYIFTNLIEGAYYEFGVYQGQAFVDNWKIYLEYKKWVDSQIESSETWRREVMKNYVEYKHDFYGFDTFEGMPDNNEGNRFFSKGSYLASEKQVRAMGSSFNMRYKLYKGLFSDIDDKIIDKLQPVAILNLDCDLYLSARSVLEKIKNKLQQGTIVLMDDYNCFLASNEQGERRALREFTEKYPQFSFEPWCAYHYVGQSFICHVDLKKSGRKNVKE